jgi:hypothetical protein
MIEQEIPWQKSAVRTAVSNPSKSVEDRTAPQFHSALTRTHPAADADGRAGGISTRSLKRPGNGQSAPLTVIVRANPSNLCPVVRKIVSNAADTTHGEEFSSGTVWARNDGQSGDGGLTPRVGGMKSPHRQPSPPPCMSFHDGREPRAAVRLGKAGKRGDRSKRFRFGSGADSDSTDQ